MTPQQPPLACRPGAARPPAAIGIGAALLALLVLLAALVGKVGAADGSEPSAPATAPAAAPVTAATAAELAARRSQVESLAVEDRQALARRWDRFKALPEAERARLRGLDRELRGDPEAAALQETLERYSHWLAALPPLARQQLADLPPAERIERIKSFVADQARRDQQRLSTADQEVLRRWLERAMKQLALRKMLEFAERASWAFDPGPDAWGEIVDLSAAAADPPLLRHRRLLAPLRDRFETELSELRAGLSADARARLEGRPVDQQWRIVGGWIADLSRPRGRPLPPGVGDEALAEFFESGISDRERDRLLRLTPDEMQLELRRLYLFAKGDGGPRRGDARGRGEEPGFGPPGGHRPWPKGPPPGFEDRRRPEGDDRPPPDADTKPPHRGDRARMEPKPRGEQ